MTSGSKITQLTSASSVQAYDIFPIVSGSPSTPLTQNIRVDTLFQNIPVPINSTSGSLGVAGNISVAGNITGSGNINTSGSFSTSGSLGVSGNISGSGRLDISGSGKIAGDFYTDAFQNYGSTSTIVGFSSTIDTSIRYKKIGKLVFVDFLVSGTSNSGSFTFTLPYDITAGYGWRTMCRVVDNGTTQTSSALLEVLSSAPNTVKIYKALNSTAFTASGTKSAQGQFFYETA